MLDTLRMKLGSHLLEWSCRLYNRSASANLQRQNLHVLIFFHGYSLARTIRPLVIARTLRARGYHVEFAGTGSHQSRVVAEGFLVHEVETLPQSRMDEYVARGDYACYDLEWIDRCVQSERTLIRKMNPDLLIADLRPTLKLSASLEGVALVLIEAGYNQPGYPFPISLPQSFSTSPGPFAEYLNQQATIVTSSSTVYLVAEVPEFHPPGSQIPPYYHYVGPLIETDIPEPQVVPELVGEGWDTTQPLIYFNCGSTGVAPEFLGAMLDELAQFPCRVLVTTAGRCSIASPSPHIRLVDFLPASWVMRRAALLVGIGGIGSIYHALREGVPVIGAPEHLEQEYHLNRVRDLGLGLKLTWEEFHQITLLLGAIKYLLNNYSEFRKQCEAFSVNVRKWQGGAAAADVIDRYFFSRQSANQIAPEYLVSEAEFIHHLVLSTPANLGTEVLQSLLRQNLRRGLPHVKQGPLLSFDQRDSWNWLYDYESQFFESDYRALEQKRQQFFVLREGKVVSRRCEQHYRLTYTYRVYPQSLVPEQPIWIFLPYPISTQDQQVVGLNSCSPENLQEYLLPTAGFFYGYPAQRTSSPLEFTYTCELITKARLLKSATGPQTLSCGEYRQYTEIDADLRTSVLVRALRQELELDQELSKLEKARRIYFHLAQTKRFKKSKESCQCLGCSTRLVLSDMGGHCITLARAFIALCRLESIPAREVAGALAGYPAGEEYFEMGAFDEPLFGHTWAEIFVEEYGWLPVEFHGIVIGKRAMTVENVSDPVLREHIATQGDLYLDYYFGNLDCHRVVCSNSVKKIPQLLIQEKVSGGLSQPHLPKGVHYECIISFECL